MTKKIEAIIREEKQNDVKDALQRIGIIGMTQPDVAKPASAGFMDGLLVKPLELATLQTTLQHVWQRQGATPGGDIQQQMQHAQERLGGDLPLLRNIARGFLDDYAERLQSLQQAIQQNNRIAAQREANSLKSNLIALGAISLAGKVITLEKSLPDMSAGQTPIQLQQLANELPIYAETLRSWLKKPGAPKGNPGNG